MRGLSRRWSQVGSLVSSHRDHRYLSRNMLLPFRIAAQIVVLLVPRLSGTDVKVSEQGGPSAQTRRAVSILKPTQKASVDASPCFDRAVVTSAFDSARLDADSPRACPQAGPHHGGIPVGGHAALWSAASCSRSPGWHGWPRQVHFVFGRKDQTWRELVRLFEIHPASSPAVNAHPQGRAVHAGGVGVGSV